MTIEELEAPLNAHREVLITMMSALVNDEKYAAVFEELHTDTMFVDGEEDPGVMPSPAFAAEMHVADEIRRLLKAAPGARQAR